MANTGRRYAAPLTWRQKSRASASSIIPGMFHRRGVPEKHVGHSLLFPASRKSVSFLTVSGAEAPAPRTRVQLAACSDKILDVFFAFRCSASSWRFHFSGAEAAAPRRGVQPAGGGGGVAAGDGKPGLRLLLQPGIVLYGIARCCAAAVSCLSRCCGLDTIEPCGEIQNITSPRAPALCHGCCWKMLRR